jgi:SagB-type dehydrogenase family enzyme
MSFDPHFRRTELDRTTFPAWRDGILEAEAHGAAHAGESRTYPGYPRWPLLRVRPRLWPPLDHALANRRCHYPLGEALPSLRQMSRLLLGAHGTNGQLHRGPTPSAGGLQALELYICTLQAGWLPAGIYHYDRIGHYLSQLATTASRPELEQLVPSLGQLQGGSVVILIIGDGERVCAKYSDRGLRFLLLEAGHLMQNICLVSGSLGMATVPLGGFFEREIARRMSLPDGDVVLYAGACGGAPRQ